MLPSYPKDAGLEARGPAWRRDPARL